MEIKDAINTIDNEIGDLIGEFAGHFFDEHNDDETFSDFDLVYFIGSVERQFHEHKEEIYKKLQNGMFYERKVTELLNENISHFQFKYQSFKPKDIIYYTEDGKQINEENATQKEFEKTITSFLNSFYENFYSFLSEYYYDLIEDEAGSSNTEDLIHNSFRKSINSKSQILVLQSLGVFDLPQIDNLTLEQKGKFFGKLLSMNFDNAKDYIGNRYKTTRNSGNKSPYNKTSIQQANELLALINLPPIK